MCLCVFRCRFDLMEGFQAHFDPQIAQIIQHAIDVGHPTIIEIAKALLFVVDAPESPPFLMEQALLMLPQVILLAEAHKEDYPAYPNPVPFQLAKAVGFILMLPWLYAENAREPSEPLGSQIKKVKELLGHTD